MTELQAIGLVQKYGDELDMYNSKMEIQLKSDYEWFLTYEFKELVGWCKEKCTPRPPSMCKEKCTPRQSYACKEKCTPRLPPMPILSYNYDIYNTQYYTERTGLRRKYAKLSIGADVLQQIICSIKIRRAPTRHDNMDFRPIITRIAEILPLSVVTADKGYDSEDNHFLIRDGLHALSIIPARYEHVPIWRTHGVYRKQMKHGYSKLLYNHRNKDETIVSVIKRLFGEHIMSRLTRTQNRELSFRCITYNMHRLTNHVILMIYIIN